MTVQPAPTWTTGWGRTPRVLGAALAGTVALAIAVAYMAHVVESSLALGGLVGTGPLGDPVAGGEVVGRARSITRDLVVYVGLAGFAVLFTAVMWKLVPRAFTSRSQRSTVELTGWALLLLPTAHMVAVLPAQWLTAGWSWTTAGIAPGPSSISSWLDVYDLAGTSLSAGIGEEVCALAVPLWVAATFADAAGLGPRWRRWGLWTIGVVLVVVRMAYHLYQGPSAVQHLLWAVATVVLFCHTRRLLPIIITHVLSDVTIFVGGALAPDSRPGALVVFLAPTLILGAGAVLAGRRTGSARSGLRETVA